MNVIQKNTYPLNSTDIYISFKFCTLLGIYTMIILWISYL